eukprot:4659814-Amphidinium_carterae.1
MELAAVYSQRKCQRVACRRYMLVCAIVLACGFACPLNAFATGMSLRGVSPQHSRVCGGGKT